MEPESASLILQVRTVLSILTAVAFATTCPLHVALGEPRGNLRRSGVPRANRIDFASFTAFTAFALRAAPRTFAIHGGVA